MEKATAAVKVILSVILVSISIVAFSVIFPSSASAEEISVQVQTAQLLPPGNNTCSPLAASGFTPYVYDNSLHSFELTLQDSSYVAVVGAVGNSNIPLNLISRRAGEAGSLRIHADVATTPVRGELPITITFLSAKGPGLPVCVSVVTAKLQGPAGGVQVPVSAPASSIPSGQITPPSQKPSTPSVSGTTTAQKPATVADKNAKDAKGKTGTTSAALGVTQNVVTALKDICSPKKAPVLWTILLALYAVGTAAVVFGKSRMPNFMKSQESIAAAIVIPFLLLFALWYFAESCRINAWAPAIATIIALAGLSVAFWEGPKSVQGVINLPSAKR